MDFSKTLHDGMIWTILKMTCSCFWSLISIASFQDDLLQELSVFMHGCMLSLKNQQWYRASYVTISYTSIPTYLPCCGVKRVADTFVEVSLVFGFCCWLTPITLTVLCVSTCSDGLLDFHMVAELV